MYIKDFSLYILRERRNTSVIISKPPKSGYIGAKWIVVWTGKEAEMSICQVTNEDENLEHLPPDFGQWTNIYKNLIWQFILATVVQPWLRQVTNPRGRKDEAFVASKWR